MMAKGKWVRPKPCWCGGYWFPHRIGSGACHHNPNIATQVRILAERHKWTEEDKLDAFTSLAWDKPGIPTKECPF